LGAFFLWVFLDEYNEIVDVGFQPFRSRQRERVAFDLTLRSHNSGGNSLQSTVPKSDETGP